MKLPAQRAGSPGKGIINGRSWRDALTVKTIPAEEPPEVNVNDMNVFYSWNMQEPEKS